MPPNSPQIKETERSLQRLKPRLDDTQKRETAEMLDKLKGLGNSVLGASDSMIVAAVLRLELKESSVYRLTIFSLSPTDKVDIT